MKNGIRRIREFFILPRTGQIVFLQDFFKIKSEDPGVDKAIKSVANWLAHAQDYSKNKDNGIARHYNLLSGWGSSYPETSGYIIPTLIDYANYAGEKEFRGRAEKVLDWLIKIQMDSGAFQGGTIDAPRKMPVTFNTGQILIGLASGVRDIGDKYRSAMCKAADWLKNTQDNDGCWRKFASSYAKKDEKAYDAHVAWGLIEAGKLEHDKGYQEAAIKNLNWVLKKQTKNGWLENCCLTDPSQPLTHTIGYAIRGILEGYLYSKEIKFLNACEKASEGLLNALRLRHDGCLPGRFDKNWNATVSWSCLTGNVQIAYCWFKMYQLTGNKKYLESAKKLNKFVRKTVNINGREEIRGGVKGSYPVYGDYGRYEYLCWAAKFFIDSNLAEKQIEEGDIIASV